MLWRRLVREVRALRDGLIVGVEAFRRLMR